MACSTQAYKKKGTTRRILDRMRWSRDSLRKKNERAVRASREGEADIIMGENKEDYVRVNVRERRRADEPRREPRVCYVVGVKR